MAFTAHDAAQALRDVPDIEERLTSRVLGITLMLWGLAAAGIFVAYAAYAATGGPVWVDYVLWSPIVAIGMVATHHLWQAHHQVVRVHDNGHQWWRPLATLALPALALWLIADLWLGLDWGIGIAMLFGNGVSLAVLGWFWRGPARWMLIAGGADMELGAIAVGIWGPTGAVQDLVLAAIALLGWAVPGMLLARRG